MVGRFHLVTSAVDGVTSSTAYVPEAEPKNGLEREAEFDDVMDAPTHESKVEVPEKDTSWKKRSKERT